LALTFTNKAVNEMKDRLLERLLEFSGLKPLTGHQGLFDELAQEWGWTPQKMQAKSLRVLRAILHHYSYLEVSTLDRFAHRIIRTFAQDLKLPASFEVVLDTESIQKETVSRLWAKLDQDPELSALLIDFSWTKIDQNKSWDVSHDLMQLGKRLFQEQHRTHLDHLPVWTAAEWKGLESRMQKEVDQLEQRGSQRAGFLLSEIESRDLASDFHGTRLNTLKTIRQKGLDLSGLGKTHYKGLLEGEGGKASELPADFSEKLRIEMAELVRETRRKKLLENWTKNVRTLALLSAFKKEYEQYCEEAQLLPLAEFNRLLAEQIKEQPAPYLYERLGTQYHHFLIDEFQDTSILQWSNLVPLIGHAIEAQDEQGKSGSLLLVGDAKQAIYRWRGGYPEQFIDLIFGRENPFQPAPLQLELESNWRSAPALVDFNNRFFRFLAQALDLPLHQNLFAEKSEQQAQRTNPGKVELSFSPEGLSADEEAEWTLSDLEDRLEQLRMEGVAYSDICILTRTNALARSVAQYLLEREWPLVSPDALLIDDHPQVQLLLSFLRYLAAPQEKEPIYEVCLHFAKEEEDVHAQLQAWMANYEAFLQERFGIDAQSLSYLGLYELCVELAARLGMVDKGQAYIAAFLEEVLVFERKEGNQLLAFLDYWSDRAARKTLPTPEGLDAIQLMTIHKAKGLEFPVVLFPFADRQSQRLHEQQIWVPAQELGESELPVLPLNCGADMLEYPDSVLPYTQSEWGQQQLDQINVIYVALTRAAQALYLWSGRRKTWGKGAGIPLGYWLPAFIQNEGRWDEEQKTYSWPAEGTIQWKTLSAHAEQPKNWSYQLPEKKYSRFLKHPPVESFSDEVWEARLRGDLIHEALGHIHTLADIPLACESIQAKAKRIGLELSELSQQLSQLVESPELEMFFRKRIQGYNEKEMISASGELLRPDRLIIEEDGAHLLEYKTGKAREQHRRQLLSYGELLNEMGLPPKTMALVYLQDPPEVVFL
jgi:ATP-dependent exoDNAse (exonuclease V) beta subunit